MTSDPAQLTALMRLRVSAEGEPSALTRLLGYFQNLNVTPQRVIAELSSNCHFDVLIDVSGICEERMELLARKAVQVPSVLRAYWHRI